MSRGRVKSNVSLTAHTRAAYVIRPEPPAWSVVKLPLSMSSTSGGRASVVACMRPGLPPGIHYVLRPLVYWRI